MKTYDITVERDGRWWMITVPEIDGVTQARRVGEIDDMARSLIAISTGIELSEVAVRVCSITVPDVGDIASASDYVNSLRGEADALEAKATAATRQFAIDLTAHGVPVRDAAELLHVSPQRVSQLTR